MHLNKITSLLFLISILLFSGCDSSGQKTQEVGKSKILGKWVIQKIDLITDPSLITPSDTMDLITMFGAQIWSLAEGKHFEFKEDGVLLTDLLLNDPKLGGEIAEWVEISKTISFGYKFDSDLTIFIKSEGEIVLQSPVEVISLNSREMTWEVGEINNVTLRKLK